MAILSNVSISLKDIVLLIIGSILSYFVGLIVAAQTDKRRNLIVELLRREIIFEQGNYYPFKIQENETEEILNNC
jgi:hypothetical protein